MKALKSVILMTVTSVALSSCNIMQEEPSYLSCEERAIEASKLTCDIRVKLPNDYWRLDFDSYSFEISHDNVKSIVRNINHLWWAIYEGNQLIFHSGNVGKASRGGSANADELTFSFVMPEGTDMSNLRLFVWAGNVNDLIFTENTTGNGIEFDYANKTVTASEEVLSSPLEGFPDKPGMGDAFTGFYRIEDIKTPLRYDSKYFTTECFIRFDKDRDHADRVMREKGSNGVWNFGDSF